MGVMRVYIRAIEAKVLILLIFVPLARFRGCGVDERDSQTEVRL
jgi:hypothetical protein